MKATTPAQARLPLFLPYQERWIRDDAPIKLMEKSRQIGISWATAYRLVITQGQRGQRLDAWVSSRDELQGKLFLEDCRAFARILDTASRAYGEPLLEERHAVSALALGNGRRIYALSSNPDAQAGKRGTRILDEFALHPDPELLYRIAWPGVTWGGRIEIISTHRGRDNFFNTLVQEVVAGGNPKGVSHHRVTLIDAVEQGLLSRLQPRLEESDPRKHMSADDYLQYVRERCPDEASWRQEYLCEPMDASMAFLPWEDLEVCMQKAFTCKLIHNPTPYAIDSLATVLREPGRLLGAQARPLYLGVDLARTQDLSAFALLEQVATGHYALRTLVTFKDAAFSLQEQLLDTLLGLPGLKRCCMDQSGLGRQFLERAQERHGARRVEGIQFTPVAQETLAYALHTCVHEHRIQLPEDRDLAVDLRALRRETTATGQLRFCASRGVGGHGDRFWAIALALYAAPQLRGNSGAVAFAKLERPGRAAVL